MKSTHAQTSFGASGTGTHGTRMDAGRSPIRGRGRCTVHPARHPEKPRYEGDTREGGRRQLERATQHRGVQ